MRSLSMNWTRVAVCIAFWSLIILSLPPAHAQQAPQSLPFELTVLMDDLVNKMTTFEIAYSPVLTGTIARTRRLEVFSQYSGEIETIASMAAGRTDTNSLRLLELIETAQSTDPTVEEFRPVIQELWVRSLVLQCELRGIGADVVVDYVRRASAGFVANRGDFSHPEFDESTLTSEDRVQIYLCGFGLVVLIYMDGGIEQAVALYQESSDLRGYYGSQLIFRGADLDASGLPLIQAVLFDPATDPAIQEIYFGMIAGKLIGPSGQFGNELSFSDEWKETIADWAFQHIQIPERISARAQAPMYGINLEGEGLGPESLLGLLGSVAADRIESLLGNSDPVLQVSGLESLRWFDIEMNPEQGARLFSLAESLMSNGDLAVAVLAESVFEADALYGGEPYDEARCSRLRSAIPVWCDLLNRVLEEQEIEYLSSTAWLDIYREGSLADEIAGCMPMVARVIVSDWARKLAGETVSVPEADVEVLTHFIPGNPQYFETTSDALRGFLVAELDAGEMNPFRVWTYVRYLQAAKEAGIVFSDDWTSAIVRLDAWVESQEVLIRGEELRAALDSLLF